MGYVQAVVQDPISDICLSIDEALNDPTFIFLDSLVQLDGLFTTQCSRYLGILRSNVSLSQGQQDTMVDTLRFLISIFRSAVVPRIVPYWYFSSARQEPSPAPLEIQTHPTCTWIMRYILNETKQRISSALRPSPINEREWENSVFRKYLPTLPAPSAPKVMFDDLRVELLIHDLDELFHEPIFVEILPGMKPFRYELPCLLQKPQPPFDQSVDMFLLQVEVHAFNMKVSSDTLLEAHGRRMQWGTYSQ